MTAGFAACFFSFALFESKDALDDDSFATGLAEAVGADFTGAIALFFTGTPGDGFWSRDSDEDATFPRVWTRAGGAGRSLEDSDKDHSLFSVFGAEFAFGLALGFMWDDSFSVRFAPGFAFAFTGGARLLAEGSDDDFAAGIAVGFGAGVAAATFSLALAFGFSSEDVEEGAFAEGRAGAFIGSEFLIASRRRLALPPE
jgi:hypothetical protein